MNFEILRDEMNLVLSKSRYNHTIGVTYLAAALAMRYEISMEQAMIAGMLHDNGKRYNNMTQLNLCKEYHVGLSELEEKSLAIIHGKLGAYIAMHTYGISDMEVITAIVYHSTGRPNMTMLEKIIFVADYLEPGRKEASNLKEIRDMVFVNIDISVEMILRDTKMYLEKNGIAIHPRTQEAYNYYVMVNDHYKER